MSRFLRVRIEAAVPVWLEWARSRGNIHDKVAAFVEQAPNVFKDPGANPRAWTYASNLLRRWEAGAQNQDLLATALAGVLGEQWAVAFLQFYGVGSARPLTASQIIHSYGAHRHTVRQWLRAGQLDLVVASLELLKRHLQHRQTIKWPRTAPRTERNLEKFFSDLPGDIKRLLRAWLKERGFDRLKVARKVRP